MIDRIRFTKTFDRQYKRLRKKHFDMTKIDKAIDLILTEDQTTLIRKFDWHFLKGNHHDIQDIHLDDNWLLLYEIVDDEGYIVGILATGDHDILKTTINRNWHDL